jgi:hypothetical protein
VNGNDLNRRERRFDDLEPDRRLIGPERAIEVVTQPPEIGAVSRASIVFHAPVSFVLAAVYR